MVRTQPICSRQNFGATGVYRKETGVAPAWSWLLMYRLESISSIHGWNRHFSVCVLNQLAGCGCLYCMAGRLLVWVAFACKANIALLISELFMFALLIGGTRSVWSLGTFSLCSFPSQNCRLLDWNAKGREDCSDCRIASRLLRGGRLLMDVAGLAGCWQYSPSQRLRSCSCPAESTSSGASTNSCLVSIHQLSFTFIAPWILVPVENVSDECVLSATTGRHNEQVYWNLDLASQKEVSGNGHPGWLDFVSTSKRSWKNNSSFGSKWRY